MNTYGTRRTHRGVIFVISIVALAVMVVVGAIFMSLAVQQFNDARRDLHALHALALADAGVNYMIHLKQQDPATEGIASGVGVDVRALAPDDNPTVPLKTLGTDGGQFVVWLLTVPDNTQAYQIVSRGYYRKDGAREYSRVVRTLVRAPGSGPPPPDDDPDPPPIPPIFDYAFFSDDALDIKAQSSINGDIGSNGNIEIKNKAVVGGGAYIATGHVVNNKGTLNGSVSTGPRIAFPTISLGQYRKYAEDNGGLVINGNWDLPAMNGGSSTFTFPPAPGNIVYVHGDINVAGNMTFNGAGTIVAKGDINFSSHVYSAVGPESSLVMISGEDMKITAHTVLQAALLVLGHYRQTAHVDLTGAVIAKDTSFTSAHATINYKKPSTDAFVIPPDDDDDDDGGNNANAWTVASWERL